MDALLILLIPLLLITAVIVSARPKHKGRRLKVLALMLGVPFATFFGDEVVEQGYLHTLCSLYGGYQYKELIKADGYLDIDETQGCSLGCLEALTRWGYSYYETNIDYSYPYHASGGGLYQFYLADRNSGLCAGGREIPREKGILPNDKCVAWTKPKEPRSRYEVSMIRTSHVIQAPFKLDKVYSYVKDRKTNEIVASATSYRYWGGWVRNNSFGHNSATVCPSFQDSHGAIENMIITSNAK